MQRWDQHGNTPKKKLPLKSAATMPDDFIPCGGLPIAYSSLAVPDAPVQFLNENYKSLPQELKKWSTADVVRWLDQRGLAEHFAVIFHENQVTGNTLLEGNLHFIDSLKDISIENRESLLSSIYELLNPTSIQVREEELEKFSSNVDREKYLAAIHVAQSKDTHLHLVEATSPSVPSAMSTSSSCSSPFIRHIEWPNHDNDSDCMRQSHISLDERDVTVESCSMSSIVNNWGAASISRNVTRHVSLYELLGLERRREVCCIRLCQPENSDFNFSVETTDQGYILVDDPKDQDLNHGDRILEVNGVYICNENDLKKAIKHSTCLNMVVVRSEKNTTVAESSLNQPQINETPPESKNLKNQVCELRSKLTNSEWRWHKLREMVLQMKEKDIDALLKDIPNSKSEEVKDKYILQEEVRQLQEALTNSTKKITHLQKALESKTAALQELGTEHEELMKKMDNQHQKNSDSDDSLSREALGNRENWRNLSESKDDLLEELKEKTTEANQQKAFLDNLLSAVVKHAPWLLDDVDADLESMAAMSHVEEWC